MLRLDEDILGTVFVVLSARQKEKGVLHVRSDSTRLYLP